MNYRSTTIAFIEYKLQIEYSPEEAVLGANDQDVAVVVLVLRFGVVVGVAPEPSAVRLEGLFPLARAQAIHLTQGGGREVAARRGAATERASHGDVT